MLTSPVLHLGGSWIRIWWITIFLVVMPVVYAGCSESPNRVIQAKTPVFNDIPMPPHTTVVTTEVEWRTKKSILAVRDGSSIEDTLRFYRTELPMRGWLVSERSRETTVGDTMHGIWIRKDTNSSPEYRITVSHGVGVDSKGQASPDAVSINVVALKP